LFNIGEGQMGSKQLKDTVYTKLRLEILTGKIAGGTHVTESSIANRFDVSRTPVREALQRLTQEKLITPLPRAGYLVEDMSDEDIQDLFSTRFMIEMLVMEKAVQHISKDELELMAENIEKTKKCVQSGELQRMTELDLEFHSIIYKASRSKSLYRICSNLGDLTLKYRYGLNLVGELWADAIDHHTAIYQALLARDSAWATTAIRNHGEQAKAQLIDILKKLRLDEFCRS
jgi:DNA-binding GntR family transcriptional regulator